MNQLDFNLWCRKLGLPEEGKKLLERIRKSEPVRKVSSGIKSVSGRYCSRKMMRTIQFESHTVEFPTILELERNKDVLEYYDQPTCMKIRYQAKNGKMVGHFYTPDFLVMRESSVGFEECKTESKLEELSVKQPYRYSKDENGVWRSPPAEKWAAEHGFYLKIRSSKELNATYFRNLVFLDDYLRQPYEVSDLARASVIYQVSAHQGISVADLKQQSDTYTQDDIYAMLVDGEIYVDLQSDVLADGEHSFVYLDEKSAPKTDTIAVAHKPCAAEVLNNSVMALKTGEILLWDSRGWTILNVGESKITLQSERNETISLSHNQLESLIAKGEISHMGGAEVVVSNDAIQRSLKTANSADLAVANERHKIVLQYLAGKRNMQGPSARTIRRWTQKYRQAQHAWDCGYIGLLPKSRERGNRIEKLPQDVRQMMDQVIKDEYETLEQKKKYMVHGILRERCKEQSLICPSYSTFCKAINARPKHELIVKRKGSRAAYSLEMQYWNLEINTPRHGDRPFEICHIDHTELDIELVAATNGKNIGRPWATFMVDSYSRRLVAIYLTYEPPSYRSCMMTIRECVRRNGRLPQMLVVDGGKEFQSEYFETLLARFEVTKKTRPPAKARFGSICERMFGTANTTFVHNLIGNTQITKNVRQVTKSVNPKNRAIWTLELFYDALSKWAYEIYDTTDHPAFGLSPREVFQKRFAECGERNHRLIMYDEAFRIFTLPTTTKGTAKIDPGRGVKIKHIYYWSDVFRDPEIEKCAVEVRYDPFDIGVAYAFVKKQWIHCRSQFYAVFQGRTEKEIQIVTEEIRKQHKEHGRKQGVTASHIANFILHLGEKEKTMLQNKFSTEGKTILKKIDGGKVDVTEVGKADKKTAKCDEVYSQQEIKFEMYEDY